jgi:hypothetical protein
MTQISFDKSVFGKNNFEKVVDTRFKQLVGTQPSQGDITISDFNQFVGTIYCTFWLQ